MNHTARTELVEACGLIGLEVPRWTQGAGGNISVKTDDALWIKASGCRLDAVGPDATVACLPLQALRQGLHDIVPHSPHAEQAYADLLQALSLAPLGRASMESGFHALLPQRFVAHFHALSAVVMAQVATAEPARWAAWLAAQSINDAALTVLQAVAPGLHLSLAVAHQPNFQICLLRQHGVILQGDGAQVIEHWRLFEQAFCADFDLPTLAPGAPSLQLSGHAQGPWRHYFPDAVVFDARVNRIAPATSSPSSGNHHIDAAAAAQDADAAELWLATQALHRAYPALVPLNDAIATKLHAMPTERWRQRMPPHESRP